MWDRNATPSSSTLRKEARLKIWYPPESVRMLCAPSHEAVQAAGRAITSRPGPEVQVVGVAEDEVDPQILQVVVSHRLHGGVGSHRHEAGRSHGAVPEGERPRAGAAGRVLALDGERGHPGRRSYAWAAAPRMPASLRSSAALTLTPAPICGQHGPAGAAEPAPGASLPPPRRLPR